MVSARANPLRSKIGPRRDSRRGGLFCWGSAFPMVAPPPPVWRNATRTVSTTNATASVTKTIPARRVEKVCMNTPRSDNSSDEEGLILQSEFSLGGEKEFAAKARRDEEVLEVPTPLA